MSISVLVPLMGVLVTFTAAISAFITSRKANEVQAVDVVARAAASLVGPLGVKVEEQDAVIRKQNQRLSYLEARCQLFEEILSVPELKHLLEGFDNGS